MSYSVACEIIRTLVQTFSEYFMRSTQQILYDVGHTDVNILFMPHKVGNKWELKTDIEDSRYLLEIYSSIS